MASMEGQQQVEKPEARSSNSAQKQLQSEQQSPAQLSTRKVSLDPSGANDVHNPQSPNGEGFGSRKNALSQMGQQQQQQQQQQEQQQQQYHFQQQQQQNSGLMDFNNMMMGAGAAEYNMHGGPHAYLPPMHDPLMGGHTMGGGGGGGDQLMNFPPPSRFLQHSNRRHTMAPGGGPGTGFHQHHPQRRMSLPAAGGSDNHNGMMMDDLYLNHTGAAAVGMPRRSLGAAGPSGIVLDLGGAAPSYPHLNRSNNNNNVEHQALLQQLQSGAAQSNTTKKKERAPSSTSFPVKLYKILSDPQYRDIITWLPHGRAWRILKPKSFEEDVIPKFFRSDRYASFMRQVNGWGFKRITEGPDLNAYYHEMFLRGLPKVAGKMRRPQKGDQLASLNKELGQHPDFYKISLFAPLPELDDDDDASDSDDNKTKSNNKKSEGSGKPEAQNVGEAPLTPHQPVTKPHAAKLSPDATEITHSPDSSKVAPTTPTKGKSGKRDDNGDGYSSPESSATAAVTKMFHSPGEPIPTVTTSEHQHHFINQLQLTSPSYAGAHELVDMSASPGNASIHTWNEPRDQDLSLWAASTGNTPIVNRQIYPSPATRQDILMGGGFGSPHHANSNNLYQVTPPTQQRPVPPRGMAGRNMPPLPHHRQQQQQHRDGGEHNDSNGLSVADLCYLTQQNRILLQNQGKIPK